MEVTGCAREPFLRESESQSGSAERLAFLQMVFRVVLIDASNEVVIFCIIGVDLQTVVPRIAQSSSNHIASEFVRFPVEREHHLCMIGVGVACSVLVLDDLQTRLQQFFGNSSLVSPRAVEMRQPYLTATDGQTGRSKGRQGDGLLLTVGDFSPSLNHVHVVVSFVA